MRPARLRAAGWGAAAAIAACLALAGCAGTPAARPGAAGAARNRGNGGGAVGASAAASAGGATIAGEPAAIPPGATAAAQLQGLRNCTPTPGDGTHPRWLVAPGAPLPTYTVPAASPRVGSTLHGWPAVPMVTLGDCRHTEAWAFAAADSRDFYLAVQVDSALPVIDGTDAAPWAGDCVQLAFDPQDARTAGSYGPFDTEMGMVLLDGQASLYQYIPAGGAMPPDSVPGSRVAVTRVNGITLYEGAIPWGAIGSTVASTFGFDLVVAAGDPPYEGPNWGYAWTQGIIEAKSPSDFAQLTLSR
jgi:hypothetical protein